ncbi:hypothetical protein L208DRAFT_1376490 [Tricholoma matsutake]|nr:hypothetical protein L208DRAFT_1376490 [Tricholoma matsutake 945]
MSSKGKGKLRPRFHVHNGLSVKGYMQRRNNPRTQSWKEWAGQKIKLGRGQSDYQASETERITLFPGWAARRYVDGKETSGIDVFVSGFASNHRPAEQASRSQRAFIRLAKGFASLPKLAADVIAPDPPSSISQSTQDLLAQIPENYDVQFIEREFQRTKAGSTPSTDILEPEIYKPLLVFRSSFTYSADGSFQALFRLKWSSLCQHPGALHIAFGDPREEHELHLSAELLPPLSLSPSRTPTPRCPSTVPSILQISLTHSPIRVISDIDDTVKLSNILLGARAVFNSVFVKDLHETIIPGMGEWYTTMWSRGVRFHYVSNGPFEILPIINEFLHISQLPPVSPVNAHNRS